MARTSKKEERLNALVAAHKHEFLHVSVVRFLVREVVEEYIVLTPLLRQAIEQRANEAARHRLLMSDGPDAAIEALEAYAESTRQARERKRKANL